jgi:predicted nuclease of predicted toxin-antitoxin system
MFNFLIDECVSPKLASKAKERGYNAYHVTWLQLEGYRDTALATYAVGNDAIIVTNNGVDFRPIYTSLDVHPGLVVIIPSCNQLKQIDLFERVLDRLEAERDVINKLIEVTLDGVVSVSGFPMFKDKI